MKERNLKPTQRRINMRIYLLELKEETKSFHLLLVMMVSLTAIPSKK
jgi:hypothetical protein